MRLSTFVSLSVLASSSLAATLYVDALLEASLAPTFTLSNHYNAPIAPWKPAAKPGWYYGDSPEQCPSVPWLKDPHTCQALNRLPGCHLHCPPPYPPPKPPPSDGYTPTFTNITAAVQADDYITFGLTQNVADCKAMCNNVEGCAFVNTYHDVNGKDGSPLLTCSLFSKCHGPADADNKGGQSQPDGSIDFIINSDGYCKTK
ncbi:hypothetical protein C8J56DRAFT_1002112 [Mycena floridula]|nr:hypothetical protein C8J56DRAFT_1002112 [Mycena floridula]